MNVTAAVPEILFGAEAPHAADTGQAGVMCGLHVNTAVSDEHGFPGRDIQLTADVINYIRRGLSGHTLPLASYK